MRMTLEEREWFRHSINAKAIRHAIYEVSACFAFLWCAGIAAQAWPYDSLSDWWAGIAAREWSYDSLYDWWTGIGAREWQWQDNFLPFVAAGFITYTLAIRAWTDWRSMRSMEKHLMEQPDPDEPPY